MLQDFCSFSKGNPLRREGCFCKDLSAPAAHDDAHATVGVVEADANGVEFLVNVLKLHPVAHPPEIADHQVSGPEDVRNLPADFLLVLGAKLLAEDLVQQILNFPHERVIERVFVHRVSFLV